MYSEIEASQRLAPSSNWTERFLGSPAIAGPIGVLTARRLRALAYHRVPDPFAFRDQLELLARSWNVVDLSQVVNWVSGSGDIPPRSVWITFDDGDASVVKAGMEELDRVGAPATLFVCPGFVANRTHPWWRTVEHALASGGRLEFEGTSWTDRGLITRLKNLQDSQRRAFVERCRLEFGVPDDVTLGIEDLDAWMSSGHTLANHTWDHPCLDQCDAAEQRRQIDDGNDWLETHSLVNRRVFAYPNGNRSDSAEHILRDGEYELCALFDHRLATRSAGALRLSRLRVDSDAPMDRFRAILSGAHSGLFNVRQRAATLASATRRS